MISWWGTWYKSGWSPDKGECNITKRSCSSKGSGEHIRTKGRQGALGNGIHHMPKSAWTGEGTETRICGQILLFSHGSVYPWCCLREKSEWVYRISFAEFVGPLLSLPHSPQRGNYTWESTVSVELWESAIAIGRLGRTGIGAWTVGSPLPREGSGMRSASGVCLQAQSQRLNSAQSQQTKSTWDPRFGVSTLAWRKFTRETSSGS